MRLLQELLQLRESGGYTETFKDLDIWRGIGSKSDLDAADVDVTFDYERSHTDHPYGAGTAREQHGAVVDIKSVKLLKDTAERDDDNKVAGTLPKGTDLMKQTWWQKEWTSWLENSVGEQTD